MPVTTKRLNKGLEFDGWAIPEPTVPWEYEVDDHSAELAPGEWPFRDHSIRLAPDSAYQAWRPQYALLFDACPGSGMISFNFGIAMRPQGLGQHCAKVWGRLARADFKCLELSCTVDAALQMAQERVEKIQRLLQHARTVRDAGGKLGTAYDRYVARERAAGRWKW